MELKDYGLSRERGYLSHYEIDAITLPTRFDDIVDAGSRLTDLITSGRVRHWLAALPDPQLDDWATGAPEEEVRTAMVHYSFLVQSYVWGEAQAPKALPRRRNSHGCGPGTQRRNRRATWRNRENLHGTWA